MRWHELNSLDVYCYLAGPMRDCDDDEVFAWRLVAKELLCIGINDPSERDYRGIGESCYGELVSLDKLSIIQSKWMLANIWKPSIGTAMEVLFGYERGCRVVIVCDDVSPWLVMHSEVVVKSVFDGCSYINSFECGLR